VINLLVSLFLFLLFCTILCEKEKGIDGRSGLGALCYTLDLLDGQRGRLHYGQKLLMRIGIASEDRAYNLSW